MRPPGLRQGEIRRMTAQRRGKNVAVAGVVLQLVFTVVMLVIWLLTDSLSAMAATWLLGGGVMLWLMVSLLFYARQLEAQEALELEEISAEGKIFEGQDGSQMRPAAARRCVIERWVTPTFTLLWAAYNVALAVIVWRMVSGSDAELRYTQRGALLAVLIAFGGFLFSRYSTGMGTRQEWRPLRATGSYLLINVLFIAAVGGSLLAAWQQYAEVDRVVTFVIPMVQVALALELLVNFVLDLYRPRLEGQEIRSSFDSRLLNLLAEPDRVGHSLAEAVNYQFGFEVSKTWFYQLLTRSFAPLVLVGALVLAGMSSIVIVQDGQKCVVSRFGRLAPQRACVLGPGVHLKWPWPIEAVRRFDTGKIHEIQLGVGKELETEIIPSGTFEGREIRLWTKEHGHREELDFLVAVPPKGRKAIGAVDIASADIIKLVASVQYRITDPYKFGYTYSDAEKLLECVAHQEMVRYCSSATLDKPIPDNPSDRPEAIMTYGHDKAAAELRKRIAKAVGPGGMDLGVEIVYVGLLAAHPPPAAAEEFEKVIEARLRQRQSRYEAQAVAIKVLAEVAGEPTDALKLALAIQVQKELGDLQALEVGSDEFRRQLVEYVEDAEESIEELRSEVAEDRLAGKVRQERGGGEIAADQLTPAQILLDEYEPYLEQLRRIQQSAGMQEAEEMLAGYLAAARKKADTEFDRAVGKPAAMIAEAVGKRWTNELAQRARAESFGRKIFLYEASKEMYMLDSWLSMWDEVLRSKHKYVLGVDPGRVEHWLRWEAERRIMGGVYEEHEGEANKE